MDDIYGDLENYNDVNAIDELRNENNELKITVEQYQSQLTKLQQDYDELQAEFKRLETNYSSLLKTAKKEMERKSTIITKLNQEKDAVVLNSLKNCDKSLLNIRKNILRNGLNQNRTSKGPHVKEIDTKKHNFKVKEQDTKKLDEHRAKDENRVPSLNTVNTDDTNKGPKAKHLTDSFDKHGESKENTLHVRSKSLNIKDRRKSMPCLTEPKLSSDDDYDANNTADDSNKHKKEIPSEDKRNCDRNKYKVSDTSSTNDKYSSHHECSKESYSKTDTSRISNQKLKRINARREMYEKYRRKLSPEWRKRDHPEDWQKRFGGRNRVLESPENDRSNNHRRASERHSNHDRPYGERSKSRHDIRAPKHKLPADDEPRNKRVRTDSSNRLTERFIDEERPKTTSEERPRNAHEEKTKNMHEERPRNTYEERRSDSSNRNIDFVIDEERSKNIHEERSRNTHEVKPKNTFEERSKNTHEERSRNTREEKRTNSSSRQNESIIDEERPENTHEARRTDSSHRHTEFGMDEKKSKNTHEEKRTYSSSRKKESIVDEESPENEHEERPRDTHAQRRSDSSNRNKDVVMAEDRSKNTDEERSKNTHAEKRMNSSNRKKECIKDEEMSKYTREERSTNTLEEKRTNSSSRKNESIMNEERPKNTLERRPRITNEERRTDSSKGKTVCVMNEERPKITHEKKFRSTHEERRNDSLNRKTECIMDEESFKNTHEQRYEYEEKRTDSSNRKIECVMDEEKPKKAHEENHKNVHIVRPRNIYEKRHKITHEERPIVKHEEITKTHNEELPTKKHDERPKTPYEERPTRKHDEPSKTPHEVMPTKKHDERPKLPHDVRPKISHEERPIVKHEEITKTPHEELPTKKHDERPKTPYEERPTRKHDEISKTPHEERPTKKHDERPQNTQVIEETVLDRMLKDTAPQEKALTRPSDPRPEKRVASIINDNFHEDSCLSPDHVLGENVLAPREIKLTASKNLEDPRLKSNRYKIDSENRIVSTTVERDVDLKRIDQSTWNVPQVPIPEALQKPPQDNMKMIKELHQTPYCSDQIVKHVYVDIDLPLSNLSISMESGEILSDSDPSPAAIRNEIHFNDNERKSLENLQENNKFGLDVPDKSASFYVRNLNAASTSETTNKNIENVSNMGLLKQDSSHKTVAPYKIPKQNTTESSQNKSTEDEIRNVLRESAKQSQSNSNELSILTNSSELNDKSHNSSKDSQGNSKPKIVLKLSELKGYRKLSPREIVAGDLELSDETSDFIDATRRKSRDKQKAHKNKSKEPNTFEDTNNPLKLAEDPAAENVKKHKKKHSKTKSTKSKEYQEERVERIDTDIKLKPAHNSPAQAKKDKFSDLFGDSVSSLITPEDLGMTVETKQPENSYLPMFEDTQDAVDIAHMDTVHEELQTQKNTENKASESNNRNAECISNKMDDAKSVQTKEIVTKLTDNASNKSGDGKMKRVENIKDIYKNLFPGDDDTKDTEVLKTVILASGVQPQVTHSNNKDMIDINIDTNDLPQLALSSNKDMIDINIDTNDLPQLPNLQATPLHAFATSTPYKPLSEMLYKTPIKPPTTIDEARPESSCNSSETAERPESRSSMSTDQTHISQAEDQPDVRIFVRRRKRVKRTV